MLSAISVGRRRKSLILTHVTPPDETPELKRKQLNFLKRMMSNDKEQKASSVDRFSEYYNEQYNAVYDNTNEKSSLLDLYTKVQEPSESMGCGFQQSSRLGHVFPAEAHKEQGEKSVEIKSNGTKNDSQSNKEKTRRRRRKWYHSICRPQKLIHFLLEDWLFLAVLGIVMACLSLLIDICTDKLQTYHVKAMDLVGLDDNETLGIILRFIVWTAYTLATLMAAAFFTHYVAPQAIGSGIPEMKTILRGVALKEYLSFRTLISKLVGLTLAIGSGFPIGKEGPFVHVGSMVANLISRLVRNFKPAYANESRSGELLAAGCAAGVACTFSAPIGGVLFSIEVTAVYFAVRDYWRGFFAACCGSALFSLLRIYTHSSGVTVSAFVQTTFDNRTFYPEELFFFALIGLFCGVTGAIFIMIHRRVVLFLRRNTVMKFLFQRNWLVYPIVVSAFYATLTYPRGIGKHLTGDAVYGHTLRDFFINCTWYPDPQLFTSCKESLTSRWTEDGSIFTQLIVFIVAFYFLNILASTLPVPAGIFMPVFVLGAAIGRFFGEIMAYNFPNGVRGDRNMLVYPGVYAVVGAASFCGAVTHTVSVAVIAFELTGQLVHSLPVTIAVIIANIVCSSFQPSFFDSIIKIKHLPYLPDIPKSTSEVHSIRVEQIMVRDVKSLSKRSTYRELQDLLINMPRLKAFPVVDDPETNVLLGSVNRSVLLRMLDGQVGEKARWTEALRRAQIELQVIGVGDAIEEITRFTVVPVYLKDRRGSALMGEDNAVGLNQLLGKGNKISENPLQSLKFSPHQQKDEKHPNILTEKLQKRTSNMLLKPDNNKNELATESARKRNKILSSHSAQGVYSTIGDMLRSITNSFQRGRTSKKKRKEGDLYGEERRIWEQQQLSSCLHFDQRTIDPAPFQLVETTSLYKVHSLFSLLGIRRAYVTKCGVLVGVVALREVRTAIERAHSGYSLEPVATDMNNSNVNQLLDTDVETGQITAEDSESETDDEDCILPRVEVEENASASEKLNHNLPFSDATDLTFTDLSDDGGDKKIRHISSSSCDRQPALIGFVPEGLDQYLHEYSKDPYRQIRIVTAPQTKTASATPPCSPVSCYIVEPDTDVETKHNADNSSKSASTENSFFNNLPKYLEIMPTLLENNYDSAANIYSSQVVKSGNKVFLVKSNGAVVNIDNQIQSGRTHRSDSSSPSCDDRCLTRFRSERIVRDSFRRWAKRRRSLQPFKVSSLFVTPQPLQKKNDLSGVASNPKSTKSKSSSSKTMKNAISSPKSKISSSLTDIVSVIGDKQK